MEFTYDPVPPESESALITQLNNNANFSEYSVPMSPKQRITEAEVPIDADSPSFGPTLEALSRYKDAITNKQKKDQQKTQQKRGHMGATTTMNKHNTNHIENEKFDWDDFFEYKSEHATTYQTPRGPYATPRTYTYSHDLHYDDDDDIQTIEIVTETPHTLPEESTHHQQYEQYEQYEKPPIPRINNAWF